MGKGWWVWVKTRAMELEMQSYSLVLSMDFKKRGAAKGGSNTSWRCKRSTHRDEVRN